MKKLFIIANWKSNKTVEEAREWVEKVSNFKFPISNEKEIIVCPPVTLLSEMKSLIDKNNLSITLGSQDVSPFENGAYTGEEPINLEREFIRYAIVGHSERRSNFQETDEVVSQKAEIAKKFSITPIFCVQDSNTPIPNDTTLVAYEPVFAIGSGNPDSPENAEQVAEVIKSTHPNVQYVLYGGSVTPENVKSFTSMENINGVLVGGASLDANKFMQIIQNS